MTCAVARFRQLSLGSRQVVVSYVWLDLLEVVPALLSLEMCCFSLCLGRPRPQHFHKVDCNSCRQLSLAVRQLFVSSICVLDQFSNPSNPCLPPSGGGQTISRELTRRLNQVQFCILLDDQDYRRFCRQVSLAFVRFPLGCRQLKELCNHQWQKSFLNKLYIYIYITCGMSPICSCHIWYVYDCGNMLMI